MIDFSRDDDAHVLPPDQPARGEPRDMLERVLALHALNDRLHLEATTARAEVKRLEAQLAQVTKWWEGRRRDVLTLGAEMTRSLSFSARGWTWDQIKNELGVNRPKVDRKGAGEAGGRR